MTMPPSFLPVPSQDCALPVSSASCGSHSPSNSVLTGTPRAVAIRPRVDRRHSVMPSSLLTLAIVALETPVISISGIDLICLSFMIFLTLLLIIAHHFFFSFVKILLTHFLYDDKEKMCQGQYRDSPEGSGNFQTGPNHQLTAEV